MIIAVDVHYLENKAKAAGVTFCNWDDSEPLDIISSYTDNPLEYESGLFYKRELPCILNLLQFIDISKIHTIIVDGYVCLNNEMKYGLGYYLYEHLGSKIPIIGVAKTAFHNNVAVVKVHRGKSDKPLYVSSIGIDIKDAAKNIQRMSGEYRLPKLLKLLDTKTKDWEDINL